MRSEVIWDRVLFPYKLSAAHADNIGGMDRIKREHETMKRMREVLWGRYRIVVDDFYRERMGE